LDDAGVDSEEVCVDSEKAWVDSEEARIDVGVSDVENTVDRKVD
jgi:hypothetical protein